eukprot:CAMPEP_0173098158 /NCGR_PEP_ID=MMETSP1102-20130122/34509_1 /TAXON_ID=49646 /ORGANISM="Geminigera sp., Strain Caron Lab Isolate" /LENGTH=55 /DNA_ID=CAMNT_0013990491 /DNA_START=48 /DNA_END=212 /DNA_ORIENTATION=-
MLVEVGGKDLLMLTANNGQSCLSAAAKRGHDGMAQMLEEACRHVGMSQGEISALK